MKNKKGFVFIETIVTVVILSASLLVVYNSYSSSIQKEKNRLYYDDVSYLYRTNYVRRFLEENSNVESIKTYAFTNSYIITIGPEFDTMFNDTNIEYKESLQSLYDNYHINQMLLVKSDYIEKCYTKSTECTNSENNLSYNIVQYLKTLNDISYDFYLVVEYAEKTEKDLDTNTTLINACTPGIDMECIAQYTSLGI